MKKAILSLSLACISVLPATTSATETRLVLQITVDGLRYDLIERYGDRFVDNGIRLLQEDGVVYSNAHYLHANTETIVGHATLATGATPALHGMIGNAWFDKDTGELRYNIEDSEAQPLPVREGVTAGAQVDPSQMVKEKGRSPRSLLVPTLGDTLSAYTGGKAKVFAVSGKDRAAVAMAGHTGKAFWYSTDSGDFITSQYYYDAYPDWAAGWNAERKANAYSETAWELLNEPADYIFIEQDDRPFEVDLKGYGRVFPHPFANEKHPLFYTQLLISPVGDQLTLDLSKSLIKAEQLGQDATPDYLSISFSAVDAVNHFFGPSSLENEDIVLQVDATIEALLEFVDDQVGLEHTLVVFSADHGMADMPEYMAGMGFPADRLYGEDVLTLANEVADKAFAVEDLAQFFFRPYLYLNNEAIAEHDLDRAEVLEVISTGLEEHPGVHIAAISGQAVGVETAPVLQRIQANYNPRRSGDLYVAQEPYWFFFEKGAVAAMHGSPWRYDTHVPIIFMSEGIEAQQISRRVHPSDVAPTLSALLGMSSPAGAVGTVLTEVVEP